MRKAGRRQLSCRGPPRRNLLRNQARGADKQAMLHVVLLALFPILLLFNTPLAFVALAVAIGLLVSRPRTKAAPPPQKQRIEDHSI